MSQLGIVACWPLDIEYGMGAILTSPPFFSNVLLYLVEYLGKIEEP